MFCTNCGNEIKSGKFCSSCGAKVEENLEKKEEVIEKVENVEEVEKTTNEVVEPDVNTETTPITVVSTQEGNNTNYQTSYSSDKQEYSTKSKLAAGLFGIFFGALGVHNFYLGYIGKAVAQLLISILSCGVFAGVSSIWGLIEGIMILSSKDSKDASGKLLKD